MKVYKLFTTKNGGSDFEEGKITNFQHIASTYFFFQEDPKDRRDLDWHPAPRRQYVITFRGQLEFTVSDGKMFIVNPGDVLIADDVQSTGHKWRMLSEESWLRTYVVLKDGEDDGFVATTSNSL